MKVAKNFLLLGLAALSVGQGLFASPPARVKRMQVSQSQQALSPIKLKDTPTPQKRYRAVRYLEQTSDRVRKIEITADEFMPPVGMPAKAQGSLPAVYGLQSGSSGLYTIPLSESYGFSKKTEFEVKMNYSGVNTPDFYAGFHQENFYGMTYFIYYTVDLETGRALDYNDEIEDPDAACDMTYDSTTGKVYGLSYTSDGEGAALAEYTLTRNSADKHFIGELPGEWNAIAADKNGVIYAIDSGGDLYILDKTNASQTRVGSTGITASDLGSAEFDLATNRLYWSFYNSTSSGICEVNTSTGQATLLCNYPEHNKVIGLYISAVTASANAPAAPENLRANFVDGNLQGTITFDAPDFDFSGATAQGELTYKVGINGVEYATGRTAYGAKGISVNYTAPSPAEYEISVVLSNLSGNSPVATVKTFIGAGMPKSPENVAAVYDVASGTVNIRWSAVTESIDIGYFDASKVSYKVVRSDDTVIAGETAATSVTDNVGQPEDLIVYSYSVTTLFDGRESVASTSNTVALGSRVPPYSNDFSDGLGGFSAIDANADSKNWAWYQVYHSGCAFVQHNNDVDKDDWLFTVPFRLEADKLYMLKFNAWGTATLPERIEVKLGKSAAVSSMTTTIVKPTLLSDYDNAPAFNEPVVVHEPGIYYIGFHAISDKGMFNLYLDDVEISEAMTAEGPAAPADFTVTPAAGGAKIVTLAFTAPDKSAGGIRLRSLDKIEIYRGEDLVKTFVEPEPGSRMLYEDRLSFNGEVSYTVLAYNIAGAGLSATGSCFCGVDLPMNPESLSAVETSNPGEVTVIWTPVTADIRGTVLTEDIVTYDLFRWNYGKWNLVADGLTGNSYTFTAVADGSQDFVQLIIYAHDDAGQSNGTQAQMIAAGTPYNAIDESFADRKLSYVWRVGKKNGGEWKLLDDTTVTGLKSYDNDNGFMGCGGSAVDDGGDLLSGKIDLRNMSAPGLKFYVYNIQDDEMSPDLNEVKVQIKTADSDLVEIFNNSISGIAGADAPAGWYRVTIPLSEFKDDIIQFQISFALKTYFWNYIDCLEVDNIPNRDLVATDISAPEYAKQGDSFELNYSVRNDGTSDASDWTAELFADGELVATFPGETIPALSLASFTAEHSLNQFAEDAVRYELRIVYSGDENTDNNHFDAVSIIPAGSNLPRVRNLSAKDSEGVITLSWDEPDLTTAAPEVETADFEDGLPFEHFYDDWTFIDVDMSPVGAFASSSGDEVVEIPGIYPGATECAFFVFDSSVDRFDESFAAHSGAQFLAGLYNFYGTPNDDWAISPEIYGGGQLVSVWLRSYLNYYPEAVELCYSDGSLAPGDFVVAKSINAVPGRWTRYEVYLPAGASRFAVHYCSTYNMMIMVDDISYSPVTGRMPDLKIKGYNIWRDGVKVNSEPVANCGYTDNPDMGQHEYFVTTVYDSGESGRSDIVVPDVSGIKALETGIFIGSENHLIIVRGATDSLVTVCGVDGRVIHNGSGDVSLKVVPGVYVVKAGVQVAKVRVN